MVPRLASQQRAAGTSCSAQPMEQHSQQQDGFSPSRRNALLSLAAVPLLSLASPAQVCCCCAVAE